jgi:hypothetical protein
MKVTAQVSKARFGIVQREIQDIQGRQYLDMVAVFFAGAEAKDIAFAKSTS